MGHQSFPSLPQTRRWREVVSLIHLGAGPEQLAAAVLRVIRANLEFVGRDPAVIESVWLLLRTPDAARADNFGDALRRLGLDVGDNPDLYDLLAAVGDAVDARMPGNRGRTDVGEIAQLALVETLAQIVGNRLDPLFGPAPEDVRHHLGQLATRKNVGRLARGFFARFFVRALGYILGRASPDAVGPGRRFASLADHETFVTAVETHCHEMAIVVEKYSGDWFQKRRRDDDDPIDRTLASDYACYGFEKMVAVLTREGEADSD